MAQYLSNLPVNALVKFGKHSVASEAAQPIIWILADKNHKGYPANSVTLITEKIIDLRAFDAAEPDNSNNGKKGHAYYQLSNINAWLNSANEAGKWYEAKHTYDTPPSNANTLNNTGYESRPGFLYNFTPSERHAILPSALTAIINTDEVVNVTTGVFLPSLREVIKSTYFETETVPFPCFDKIEDRGVLTAQAYNNTASTVKPASINDYWLFMTRNSFVGSVACVAASYSYDFTDPYNGSAGLRPAVNLAATTKVSDTVDSDGCYVVLDQSIPVISGTNGDLGIKNDGFNLGYTITDGDNETVTVKEYLDNVQVRSYVATLGAENTFAITSQTWLKLANGTHTLKITATDGYDTVERICTFTKSISSLVVQRTTPISAGTKPTNIIVTVVKNIPYNARMKVEACNNGFDANPTWEDITDSVISGLTHVFANATKTASQWGVNIRVTVDRNGAEGACYITEIGGNFE